MRNILIAVLSGIFLLTPKVNTFASGPERFVIVSKASWYSFNDPTDPFLHLRNADGTRFDENDFTCAMRSRNFGKRYKVTNLRNGRSVLVRHADYGPARKFKGKLLNRAIDLSKAAFAQIADLRDGVIKVSVIEVKND
jgi:rare lipoprotein A